MLKGSLPPHMQIGRSQSPGPRTGGLITWTWGPYSETDGGSGTTDQEFVAFYCPFDFRLEQIGWVVRSTTGSDLTLEVSTNATSAIDASEVALLSTAIDLDSDAEGVAEATGTTPYLVAAARDIVRGRWIICHASLAASEVIDDLIVTITGFPYGHINDDPYWD